MQPTTQSSTLEKQTPPPLPPDPNRGSPILKAGMVILGLVLAIALTISMTLYWIYGTDTHHADRGTIWWTPRGRNLIPPKATDITLRQDFLDHDAIYTIKEADLNDFLNTRFARHGGPPLDSFSERSPVSPKEIGRSIGPLGWVMTADTVSYGYAASNGGVHSFYHDSKTGLTYQDSAYW